MSDKFTWNVEYGSERMDRKELARLESKALRLQAAEKREEHQLIARMARAEPAVTREVERLMAELEPARSSR